MLYHANQWTVLEYMTQIYMHTGTVPPSHALRSEFPGMELDEIADGECAFYVLIGMLL